MQKTRHSEHEQELLKQENRIRFYRLQMMILPDTDFKATMLNMSKEIGNDLKIDARNKNCKR